MHWQTLPCTVLDWKMRVRVPSVGKVETPSPGHLTWSRRRRGDQAVSWVEGPSGPSMTAHGKEAKSFCVFFTRAVCVMQNRTPDQTPGDKEAQRKAPSPPTSREASFPQSLASVLVATLLKEAGLGQCSFVSASLSNSLETSLL